MPCCRQFAVIPAAGKAELAGACVVLSCKTEDWTDLVSMTQSKGANVVLYRMGGSYLRNADSLASYGLLSD